MGCRSFLVGRGCSSPLGAGIFLFLKGMALVMRHVTVNLSQSHRKQARYHLRTEGAQSVPGLPAGLGCASVERSTWGASTASNNKGTYVTEVFLGHPGLA